MYSSKESSKEDLASEDGSAQSLLSSHSEFNGFKDEGKRKSRLQRLRPALVHAFIFATYTVVFAALYLSTRGQNCHKDLIYTPARKAVEWQRVEAANNIGTKSPYSGHPSPEGDAAWRELLKNSNIRIDEHTLRQLNRSSIKLQDGSDDYFGGLSAHHHLHCIKSVRRVIWRDYYGLEEDDTMWNHLDHCLEDLRLAIMCNADTSIITYDWISNWARPWGNFRVDGECVNWEKLDAWAGERAFSLFDQVSLVHPELGISYPYDKNGKLVMDSRIHPRPQDVESIALGTNPKGNWGPGP